jgi:hypothetical protein
MNYTWTQTLLILTRSWKTTTIGVVGGAVLIVPNIIRFIQGGVAEWDIVMLGLAFATGMICSKDGNLSTEDVERF